MKKLSDVTTFGGTDADADDLLEKAFQDHESFSDAVSHKRPIVIGRKGTGKTALFKKLVDLKDPETFTYGHTFAEYPWGHHKLQEQSGVPAERRYAHSWVYLINLTMAKILLNHDQTQPWCEEASEDIGQLRKFVRDSYGTPDPKVVELFTPHKRLRVKPHLKGLGDIGLGLDMESMPVSQLPAYIQEVNRTITALVARCINPKLNYYICFDELDKGFDPNDRDNAAMITGLLLAATSTNREHRKLGKRASVVVFLRNDIYNALTFEDKNKITETEVSLIEWDRAGSPWTLRALLERRFGVALEAGDTLSWDQVFDDKRLSRRRHKYDDMLSRTFRRPRDMIKFCNEVLRCYQRSGSDSTRFTNEHVIAAREEYSDYLLRELTDEIHKHLPHFQDYFDILKSLEAIDFTLSQFEEACRRRPDLEAAKESPLQILQKLFEFSVVGYERIGGAGGGSEYVWRYLGASIRFDAGATSFRVHPGLREAFGLKAFVRSESQPGDSDTEE
jgi:hypothetical protein